MRSPKLALAGVTAGAALALGTVLAAPATAAPTSPQCFQAEANVASQENVVENSTKTLSNDTIKLQTAKDELTADQAEVPPVTTGPAAGLTDVTDDQSEVSTAQTAVNNDQASLRTAQRNLAAAIVIRDTACNGTTPTPTPTPVPTTTPVPPPVSLPPGFANCAEAFAAGVSNIPSTDPRYRLYLDRDRDGVACELNGNDGGIVGDPVPVRIINGRKCHQVNGAWVPITMVTDPCPGHCPPAPTTVIVPPPVTEVVPPPVTLPGPVVQGPTTFVPGPTVSVPNTSAGVNNGDGSTDTTITITIDVGNILTTVPLPALPKV